MIAIEIVQNGNVVTLAGADNLEGGSVTVIVDGPGSDDSKGKLTVFGIGKSVGGQPQKTLLWFEKEVISVDDEILIRVKKVTEADIPAIVDDDVDA